MEIGGRLHGHGSIDEVGIEREVEPLEKIAQPILFSRVGGHMQGQAALRDGTDPLASARASCILRHGTTPTLRAPLSPGARSFHLPRLTSQSSAAASTAMAITITPETKIESRMSVIAGTPPRVLGHLGRDGGCRRLWLARPTAARSIAAGDELSDITRAVAHPP